MGEKKRKNQLFLAKHPICAFCGGGTPATTIEHCPPRALFQNRQWPEGMEFPSCDACNQGSRNLDLLVAMVGRFDPFTHLGNRDGRLPGLMTRVHARFPGLFRKMMPSLSEARRANREIGLKPPEGGTSQDTGLVKVPPEIHKAVETLAQKLVKGLFYLETGSVFPHNGGLLFQWFTNANVIREGRATLLEAFSVFSGKAPVVERTGTDLSDQFAYRLAVGEEAGVILLQARFGKSFGFVILGSRRAGHLEALAARLTEETGHQAMKILSPRLMA